MNFVALDVETANADFSSICQIGMVEFIDGKIESEWTSLVDPQDDFDPINIAIHGIEKKQVSGAPNFAAVYEILRPKLSGRIIAIHSSFDRSAINKACARFQISPEPWVWIDTASVARRTWPEISKSGYGLKSLANKFNIVFYHHDALEDARACGLILLKALEESNLDLEKWLEYSRKPTRQLDRVQAKLAPSPDGVLRGERVVFTGALMMSRQKAIEFALAMGAEVLDSVSKKTTLLVVGDQDIRYLKGQDKSQKHRKAETLIAQGVDIRILGESDFVALLEH